MTRRIESAELSCARREFAVCTFRTGSGWNLRDDGYEPRSKEGTAFLDSYQLETHLGCTDFFEGKVFSLVTEGELRGSRFPDRRLAVCLMRPKNRRHVANPRRVAVRRQHGLLGTRPLQLVLNPPEHQAADAGPGGVSGAAQGAGEHRLRAAAEPDPDPLQKALLGVPSEHEGKSSGQAACPAQARQPPAPAMKSA